MSEAKKCLTVIVLTIGVAVLVSASVGLVVARASELPSQMAASTAMGSAFTYQGQLKAGGNPVNDTCDMAFRLHDEASNGTQVGTAISTTVPITDGLFTVQLDFGASAFDGDARWLGIKVKCPGDVGYGQLSRQALTATPYSLYALSTGALQGYPISSTTPVMGEVLEWDGSAWVPATSFWSLSGNAGTTPGAHFLGTTDAQPLVIRTNGVEAMRVDAGGHVGIGTTSPGSYRLYVSAGSDNGIYVDSNANYGLYGHSTDGDGVKGRSTDGTGVVGESTTGDGVAGESTTGTGVFGESTTGDGVKGRSTDGEGVDGRSVTDDGVYGYSAYNTGVYGRACADQWPTGSNCRGVYGRGQIGVEGHGSIWGFYAADGGYGPFTGGHEVRLADDFPEDAEPGMIVSVTGEARTRQTAEGEISFSSTLPTVQLSDTPNDSTVFGVYVLDSPLGEEHWYAAEVQEGDRFGIVNALGEGRVWVTNVNGDIHAGDYVTTSPIAGRGQRQDDDLLHSYTLGKAIEEVDWSEVTETIEFGGRTCKVYPIAVVYTSG
ncbi:MAG TPA: hypothetical protein VM537_33645 [Anaerolineae bacterium]|nr:hypothetical protein [Anaerolineae bacterium]